MKRHFAAILGALVASAWLATAQDQTSNLTKEFVYKKAPQGELKLLVHYPPAWQATDQRPAMLFFFGGAWARGTVEQFRPQAEYLAKRGLVTIRADYRVSSRHNTTPADAVEDARSAMRWLRQHAAELGINPDKIIASGGSAGGHLAACTAMVPGPDAKGEDLKIPCKPCALVLFNPVVDFSAFKQADQKKAPKGITMDISPAAFLKKGEPTTIMFFGTTDRLLEPAKKFKSDSAKLGNRVELYTAEGVGHGFFNRAPWQDITLKKAEEFLVSLGYLRGPATLQIPADTNEKLVLSP